MQENSDVNFAIEEYVENVHLIELLTLREWFLLEFAQIAMILYWKNLQEIKCLCNWEVYKILKGS